MSFICEIYCLLWLLLLIILFLGDEKYEVNVTITTAFFITLTEINGRRLLFVSGGSANRCYNSRHGYGSSYYDLCHRNGRTCCYCELFSTGPTQVCACCPSVCALLILLPSRSRYRQMASFPKSEWNVAQLRRCSRSSVAWNTDPSNFYYDYPGTKEISTAIVLVQSRESTIRCNDAQRGIAICHTILFQFFCSASLQFNPPVPQARL